MFPQAVATNLFNFGVKVAFPNMNGCWDWVGWYGTDFDVKSGKQLTAMKKMIDRVTSGFNPIAAPTGLSVTKITDNSVSLSWHKVSEASGYNVYRNGEKANSGPISDTTFTDSQLTSGTSYVFTVKAISSSGAESSASDSVNAKTTGEPPAIPAPNGLAVTDITANSIALKWNLVSGVNKFNIYRNGQKVAEIGVNSYTDKGLNPSTEYRYQVSSVVNSNESQKSNEVQATTHEEKVCFTDNNYNHVVHGRAHQSGGYALANGSNQNMGLYNTFYTTKLCRTKENYYEIE